MVFTLNCNLFIFSKRIQIKLAIHYITFPLQKPSSLFFNIHFHKTYSDKTGHSYITLNFLCQNLLVCFSYNNNRIHLTPKQILVAYTINISGMYQTETREAGLECCVFVVSKKVNC